MTDSDDHWVRPRAGDPADPVTKLRSEVAVLSRAVGDATRAAQRQQATLLVVTLVLGLFLPFARTDAGGRRDEVVGHHLLGLFGQLFDSELDFVGGGHDSRSAGIGRVVLLLGIALLLVGLLTALTGPTSPW